MHLYLFTLPQTIRSLTFIASFDDSKYINTSFKRHNDSLQNAATEKGRRWAFVPEVLYYAEVIQLHF